MRPFRTVFALLSLLVAVLAGSFALNPVAGAQIPWTCAADQSPNYYPCLALADDLNCEDLSFSVHVAGGDPYGLDGSDNDGIGCDSEYGAPVELPQVTPTPLEPTPTPTPRPDGVTPTVDGQCLALEFDTSNLAPVAIATLDGGTTKSLTTQQGTWTVGDQSNVRFVPIENATFPAEIQLNGTRDDKAVVVTATADCTSGRLAEAGVESPTAGATPTAGASPTAGTTPTVGASPTPGSTPVQIAYTGAETELLVLVGVGLLVAGGSVIGLSRRTSD